MLKVKVLTVGRLKEAWLEAALSEYEKRLEQVLKIEWAIAKTEAQLNGWASKEPSLVALDLKGKLLSSEGFSQKFIHLMTENGARLVFVIGGAEGIGKELLEKCQFRWSLSPLTFTHQMTRLILVEQIYRAIEIEKGTGYHK
ncbi:MAG: 23S rRNA (pseudouridine(1915)-N(3))-methyltransferase RlmH [Chlamydiota bacterium]